MNINQKKTAGILLCVIGFWFYCQSSLNNGYQYATRNDFTHLYLAGYLAERGGDFFDAHLLFWTKRHLEIQTGLNPYVYPPFFAILLIPLSKFSYDTAWILFTLLSHAAYFASLALLVRMMRRDEDESIFWWGILMALSACFYPLTKTYSAGQMNTFMLLVITGSAFLLSKKRDMEAGALIGLGAAIKIAPAFLLVYCVWKKKWLAAASGLIIILLSLVISGSMLGMDIHGDFINMAKDMGYGSSTWAEYNQTYHIDPYNQAPSALWYRLCTSTETAQGVIQGIINSPITAKVLSYLTAIIILVLLLVATRRSAKLYAINEYALWTLGMLLLPSLFWDHYLVQAMLAITIALQMALSGKAKYAFLLGIAIAAMAMPFLHDHLLYRNGIMTLAMSLKLFAMLLLIGYLYLNRNVQYVESSDYPENSGEYGFF
jgi:glycosyl transferase family 87